MTRRPKQAHPEESRAAMARVFGVDVEAEAAPSSATTSGPIPSPARTATRYPRGARN